MKKIKLCQFLFHVLSELADRTQGFPLFASLKIGIGTFIISLSHTACFFKKPTVNCYVQYNPEIYENLLLNQDSLEKTDSIKHDTLFTSDKHESTWNQGIKCYIFHHSQ